MHRIPVYIACGGRSLRFGSDKAHADVNGTPMICRVASALQGVASRITAVADAHGKYHPLGVPTIADLSPGNGPLAALQASLHDLRPGEPWLLLVSCDMVGARAHWVRALLDAADPSARAVAFRDGGRWEPLLALFHVELRDDVDARIARAELGMQRLLGAVPAIPLPRPADWYDNCHVNTPAELSRFLQTTGANHA